MPLWIAVRPRWFDSRASRKRRIDELVTKRILILNARTNTWIASTVLLSDSLTTLCFLASSSLYLPTSLTISFSFWAICNWSWATFSHDVLSNCHRGVNVHRGPTFGAPFVLLVALLAAAMLVDEPHCLANLPNCLLYDSSREDL